MRGEVPGPVRCDTCHGRGKTLDGLGIAFPCPECWGIGVVPAPDRPARGSEDQFLSSQRPAGVDGSEPVYYEQTVRAAWRAGFEAGKKEAR